MFLSGEYTGTGTRILEVLYSALYRAISIMRRGKWESKHGKNGAVDITV